MVLSSSSLDAEAALANGFALAKAAAGHVVEDCLALGQTLAANGVAALVANKRLLREGWARTIDEVWQREKLAMSAIAQELGPIGWSPPS